MLVRSVSLNVQAHVQATAIVLASAFELLSLTLRLLVLLKCVRGSHNLEHRHMDIMPAVAITTASR